MTNCKEFILDDLTAITAIPVSDMPASVTGSVVNLPVPTIDASAFSPVLTNAVTIGVKAATAGGVLIPIIRKSGKSKDEESDSVSGRIHTVTVSCEIDERGGEIWSQVSGMPCGMRLESVAHHLILTFRNGTRGFVTATDDTYLCTIGRDGANVSMTFKIQNLMGIQMIVGSASTSAQ